MSGHLAGACLALFCLLGVFDGLYFHLYRFRLHERAESRTEHLIHTVRAFVFVPIALLFFAFDARGPALLTGLALVALDLGLEAIDILVEKRSRAGIGGISSAESAVHVFASAFRMAALAFVLGAKPLSHFLPSTPSALQPASPVLGTLGLLFAISSLAGGVYSVLVMRPASGNPERGLADRGKLRRTFA
jgi:hypothetical protein